MYFLNFNQFFVLYKLLFSLMILIYNSYNLVVQIFLLVRRQRINHRG